MDQLPRRENVVSPGEEGERFQFLGLPVVTAGETVLFWFLQDSEGAQPLNLSAKPKASESKSPNSPPTSPQVSAAAAAAAKMGSASSMKHSIGPSSIGGPPSRVSSIGKMTYCVLHRHVHANRETREGEGGGEGGRRGGLLTTLVKTITQKQFLK